MEIHRRCHRSSPVRDLFIGDHRRHVGSLRSSEILTLVTFGINPFSWQVPHLLSSKTPEKLVRFSNPNVVVQQLIPNA